MSNMGRPPEHAKVILRYKVARPTRKDSVVGYTSSLNLEGLKKKYGDKLLEVVEYQRVEVLHRAQRPGS